VVKSLSPGAPEGPLSVRTMYLKVPHHLFQSCNLLYTVLYAALDILLYTVPRTVQYHILS